MRNKELIRLGTIIVAGLFLLGAQTAASAQGRGGGGGMGRGSGMGMGSPSVGMPSGIGVDRGLSRSAEASEGRADRGPANAAVRSNRRSVEGLDRARTAGKNLHNADAKLNKHPAMARSVHMNANDLRGQYRAALVNNPNLKFGQFVAATRLAQNLGRRDPRVTRGAILAGLASGRSIGQTLQTLGLSSHEAKAAEKQAEREIKQK